MPQLFSPRAKRSKPSNGRESQEDEGQSDMQTTESEEDINEESNGVQPEMSGILKQSSAQRERPKLKKRVSFDQASIERKRGKVSRRPRRRRNARVATPIRDCLTVMATFLLTALFSSLLRDRQRRAQQYYLNRKVVSSSPPNNGDLRRKRWQPRRRNEDSHLTTQVEVEESTMEQESSVVSPELSPVESSEANLQHKEDSSESTINVQQEACLLEESETKVVSAIVGQETTETNNIDNAADPNPTQQLAGRNDDDSSKDVTAERAQDSMDGGQDPAATDSIDDFADPSNRCQR